MPPAIPKFLELHILTREELKKVNELELLWDEYDQKEAMIKAQILMSVPESIALEIQDEDKAATMWQKLCVKHKDKALAVQIDMRCRIYALRCEDKANIRTHIESMKALHEQLNGMGERIADQDFIAVVLASLPKSYQPLINVLSLQNKTSPSSVTLKSS